MNKGRMIASSIWEDEFFSSLHMIYRLIWIGIISTCADDQGRFQDSAALVRSRIFPLEDFPLQDIESALEIFAKEEKIIRYTKGGKKIIQILNWWKYQSPRWIGRSSLPAPEGWTDRIRYHGLGNKIISENFNHPGGYSIALSKANSIDGYTKHDGDGEGDVDDDIDGDDKDEGKRKVKVSSSLSNKKSKKKNLTNPEDIPNLIRSYDKDRDGTPGQL